MRGPTWLLRHVEPPKLLSRSQRSFGVPWQNPRSLSWTRPIATSPTSHQNEDKKVSLRPYQENAIQSVLGYLAKGGKRAGLSLATGSGKTVSCPIPICHSTVITIII